MSAHLENDSDLWRRTVSEDLRELKESVKELTHAWTETRLNTATTVKMEAVQRELEAERTIRREDVQKIRDDLTTAKATIATLKWVAAALGSVMAGGWAVFLVVAKHFLK
ncbi:MAG TPA: hypothetical protein VFD73_12590 [Gemmatimonadales bacterium]|nr:hypothetical protein [Gemmatimonadales bacterium]